MKKPKTLVMKCDVMGSPWRWWLVSLLLVALAELDESEARNGDGSTKEGKEH